MWRHFAIFSTFCNFLALWSIFTWFLQNVFYGWSCLAWLEEHFCNTFLIPSLIFYIIYDIILLYFHFAFITFVVIFRSMVNHCQILKKWKIFCQMVSLVMPSNLNLDKTFLKLSTQVAQNDDEVVKWVICSTMLSEMMPQVRNETWYQILFFQNVPLITLNNFTDHKHFVKIKFSCSKGDEVVKDFVTNQKQDTFSKTILPKFHSSSR